VPSFGTKAQQQQWFMEIFKPPETVDRAYKFGYRSGRAGYDLIHRAAWDARREPHPYPTSVYRAYVHGHRVGRAEYRQHGGVTDGKA
jgi:hypothetical protein